MGLTIDTNYPSMFSHLNESYLSAEEFAEDRDKSTSVPRILHFLWIIQIIPDKYLDAITEFDMMNPDYQVSELL